MWLKLRLLLTVLLVAALTVITACGGGGGGGTPSPTNATYKVIYNGNGSTGGTVPVDATNYQQGQTVTVLGNTGILTYPGYSFTGWNTKADGTGTTYAQGQTFTMGPANVTLYAIWTASPAYTVSYNGNGSTSGSVPVDSTNYLQGQTVTVPGNTGNLARTGYSFTGWNTKADGTGTTFTQGQTFSMGPANVTLYAIWTASPTYTVSYNGNGSTSGSVPVDSTNYQQGQTVTVLGNTGNLANAGYTFAGWNTKANGSGTTYAQGQTFAMGTVNVTLYAVWTVQPTSNVWTWVSGSNVTYQVGSYGTKGIAASTNVPAARSNAVSWIDSGNNLWLFGGNGVDASLFPYCFNDLWKFDGNNWTWVSGSDTGNPLGSNGTYGTKGVAASTNVPGTRANSFSWIDSLNNLWLFGGGPGDAVSTRPYNAINDLWKFDGTNWTWVSGSNTGDQPGSYGTKGVAASLNVPGARQWGASWIDSSNNLWLFGGTGYGSSINIFGSLNDLWKFDGANWMWVSGSSSANQSGTYGTKGVAASTNIPGGRSGAVSWRDSSNNLWLFGGTGYDATGSFGSLNDLWKFDGSKWTWIGGSSSVNQYGMYGTKGTAALANMPGGRYGAVSWIDSNNNLWLFGGWGYGISGSTYYLNDLWKFDGSNWTWIGGSGSVNQYGTYGTKGIAASTNQPGGRSYAVSWTDSSNNLWLFGGGGLVSSGTDGLLNDLWKFKP